MYTQMRNYKCSFVGLKKYWNKMEKVLKAISKMNYNKIEELLNHGADVNINLGRNMDSLLHCSYSLEINNLLLVYGANVHARNVNGETPLHSAILAQKGLGVVQQLIKYGVDVNAVDNEGKTALYHSVDYHRKADEQISIWKELLENGADINISCLVYQPYRHYCSSLCRAIESEDSVCAKFLIKILLIKNFKKDCRKIDFNTYVRMSNADPVFLDELASYQNDCVCEIVKIKSHKFYSNCSLYDFIVTKKDDAVKPLYASNINITDNEIVSNYPIYFDVVLPSLIVSKIRGELMDELKKYEICVKTLMVWHSEEKEVFLTSDCVLMIAEYLTNDELSNFIKAFNCVTICH